MNAKQLANRIRIMAFGCKSKDVLSCAFGNEFAPKVERLLEGELLTATAPDCKLDPYKPHAGSAEGKVGGTHRMTAEHVGRVMEGLCSMVTCDDTAHGLSDRELSEALLNVVWGELDMTGFPSSLISEAIDRLKGEPNESTTDRRETGNDNAD